MAATAATRMRRTRVPRPVKIGATGGVVSVYLAVTGIVQEFAARDIVADVLSLGRLFLLLTAFAFSYLAARPEVDPATRLRPRPEPASALIDGVTAGAITGAALGLFLLIAGAVNLRGVLLNVSPEMLETLSFEQSEVVGALILFASGAVVGLAGGAAHLPEPRAGRALYIGIIAVLGFSLFDRLVTEILGELQVPIDWLFADTGVTVAGAVVVFLVTGGLYYLWKQRGDLVRERVAQLPAQQRTVGKWVALLILLLVLANLPQVLGPFMSDVVASIGLYVLLGLGLNIVVGFAGLLDLGYVAFFAIGAYATAILTSPAADVGSWELNFWVTVPIVIFIATVSGILIGAPVLRLRGDYLAIVTLGFGEIVAVLAISNWFIPLTGGAQGITQIPDPIIGGFEFDDPQSLYYLILVAALVAAFISYRLQDSRVGRAWSAMREDESVAEAMGVSIIKYKLLAFATGAAIGSLSGILFAVRIGSVFPASFNILVSILALAVIVLGGMGSVPGVVVGSIVLVGLPELLREFVEYRLLFYGAIIAAIMILKPEGLLPSARRRAELHVEETPEELVARRAGEATAAPVVEGGS
jgi:branched-chain amino acid transport system permease protein